MPPKVPIISNLEDLDDIQQSIMHEKTVIEVDTPSGAKISLLTQAEAAHYNSISEQYQTHNKFTNISDLLELDRVLALEIMCFRQQTWMLSEQDYDGEMVPKDTQKMVQLLSKEIRDIKAGLGIDKKTRDAGKGETIADLFENLRVRAKEFGVHRNEQIYLAWRNWNGLEALITAHRNSTDVERTEFGYHIKDILAWCDERFAELHEVDEAFREKQKLWIREIQ